MKHKIISASILSADFTHLGDEIRAVLEAGVDNIHFDVMDHHYVPNLTFGPVICESIRKAGIKAPIDVHLMVMHPEDLIDAFADAGANLITFHPKTVEHIEEVIQRIKNKGMKAGLAFNPEENIWVSEDILRELDLVLMMSVAPGFAGQRLMNHSVTKISETRKLLDEMKCSAFLGIDGGIKADNIGEAAHAGADFFVVGSGLFHTPDYAETIAHLRRMVE